MLNEPQIEKLLGKIKRFTDLLEPMIFEKQDEINFDAYITEERLHSIPSKDKFSPIEKGSTWYGKDRYCLFRGEYTVPERLKGRDIFIKPHIEGYEALLFVNGKTMGTFATKIVYTSHGNHYCDMIKKDAVPNEKLDIVINFYGGHDNPGCDPTSDSSIKNYNFLYNGADICTKNYEIQEYYFDLLTVYQLASSLPQDSFMRGKAINALYDVHNTVHYLLNDTDLETFMEGLRKSASYLKEVLSMKSQDSAPVAGIIGHSHMDTAWLWHVGETEEKIARTCSNALNLMEQYPEYMFVQSSACHSDMIRRNYPELFERIAEKVKEGRYEPNGGVWVECDCNITSGESMIRQFLWGQRFTRKYFNYTSDCFWLPDTFGYSAAIPQIMKGCGVDYFLTTKMSWNDTNKFPYDTFKWVGIDGTEVFTHFNRTHVFPDAKTVIRETTGLIRQKSVTNKRLISYGFGDGGGGPQFEMLELARRIKDLDGVGKSKHTTVSNFMRDLEKTAVNPNTYKGELYLELHRGTLTNQHTIKRNNRKSELALRDLEILTVNEAVKSGKSAAETEIAPLYETLLMNQFHDILPGSCIHRAHAESREQTTALIKEAQEKISAVVNSQESGYITFTNTLSFERCDPIITDFKGFIDADCRQQLYTDLRGQQKLIVSGIKIGALSSATYAVKPHISGKSSPFKAKGDTLETSFAKVKFAENGTISSFYDKRAGREILANGIDDVNFNTFLMAEDVPSAWDNWDIDCDIQYKFKDASNLKSREIVSEGEAAYIIRSVYEISKKSTVTQDMIFFADSPEVRFDTVMDWQDDHRLLKTAFDTNISEDFARNEIQFGYVKRPTTRNNTFEEAKFEVVNHKYTDLSESRFGAAILNDCKYGITVDGGKMRLSLHKGGTHPDSEGDHDCPHMCVYSFLPHNSGFNSKDVIRPAYELNVPVIASEGKYDMTELVSVDADNIFIEAIKPCEDEQNAYIVRMYEAEGARTNARLTFPKGTRQEITNMLEETVGTLDSCNVTFRGFEIKTFKVYY
ncbi:MAG: glycosyl hydrolase-related protein [Clostridiales bacterium]|nr:glycosyl hydrolase-related protein [Clostridiales bacterium]